MNVTTMLLIESWSRAEVERKAAEFTACGWRIYDSVGELREPDSGYYAIVYLPLQPDGLRKPVEVSPT